MIIYPTIELQTGRCVSLFRGRLDEPQIWHVDPVEKAREFAKAGASWINITDFDAIAGDYRNHDLLQEIILRTGAPVQLGGGIRSLHQIEEWIEMGVGRVVVSTMAVLTPDVLKKAARLHPDQIVLSLDVFEGQVMSNGWAEPSAFDPAAFLRSFENDPLAAIIIRDISAEIEQAEDALALVTELAGRAKAPVIASGLSRSLDDLSRLKYVPHVSGAILGRALFDRSIDLSDALALAAEPIGETAEFL
jgi:phosphoribosylformimino-5-aminoimidazole carboxamide ribotide isomerase